MGVASGRTRDAGGARIAASVRASGVAVTATTCGLLAVFVTSALAPLLRRDTDVTPGRLGLAVAVFFAASTVAAIPGGRLADRVGGVRVMRVALLLAAGCLAGVTFGVYGWVALVLALGLAGVANGAIHPAANRYISRLTPVERQGLAFGIKQAAIPAAILLAGVSVPAAAYLAGWRAIYVVAAGLTVLVAVTLRAPAPARRPRQAGAPAATPSPWDPALLVLAAGWGLASTGANALGAFYVLGAVDVGFSAVAAGGLVVAGSLSSIGVRVGIGFLADGWTGTGLGVVAAMSAGGAGAVALLATGLPWAFVLATVLGYGIGWGWAGLFNYAVVRSRPGQPGRTTGLTQAGASAGACAGPLAFGFIVDHAGYPQAWVAAGATLLLAAGVILAGRRMLAAPPPAPPPAPPTLPRGS